MGGGGGGKGGIQGFVTKAITPVSTIFGKSVGKYDPAERMNEALTRNVFNVVKGKESVGSHSNYFGSGSAGDMLNPMLGGKTEQERKSWDGYERNNLKAWDSWAKKTGKDNPYADKLDSNKNSLLLDDDELL